MNIFALLLVLTQDAPVSEKKLLLKVTPDQMSQLQYSPAGGAAALTDGRIVRLNDQNLGEFPRVEQGTLCFSAAGTLAYIVGDPRRHHVVVGGKKHDVVDDIRSFRFSRNGKGYAYIAIESGKEWIVLNGQAGEKFERVAAPFSLSDDGTKIVYLAMKDRKRLVVHGTKEYEGLGPVYETHISPDGSRFACVLEEGRNRWSVLFEGKKGEVYETVPYPRFSPSGEIYYGASRGKKDKVVVGAKEYDAGGPAKLICFAADGKTPVFTFEKDSKEYLAVGEQASGPFQRVSALLPHPGGKGYVAAVRETEKKSWVTLNDQRQEEYEEVLFPSFSPDGKVPAYVGRRKPKDYVLVAGTRKVDRTQPAVPLVFNSGKMAWREGAIESVVIEGKAVREEFNSIPGPLIAVDESTVGFYAVKYAGKENELLWITAKIP